jgi:hypothetical protein
MKIERVDGNDIIVPENQLERNLLVHYLIASKHDEANYWDHKGGTFEPMCREDWMGKFLFSWSKEGERLNSRIDFFSISQTAHGFRTVLRPKV